MVIGEFFNTWVGVPGHPTPTPEGYRPWHTPTPLSFNYGFTVRAVSEGRDSVGLVMRATQEGHWFLELKGCRGEGRDPYACSRSRNSSGEWATPPVYVANTFHVIDSGYFSKEGVEFFVDKLRSNHMAFIAKGDEYRFFVNGVEIPIEIDAADRAAIEEYADRFRYVSDGKWYGSYGAFGSAHITIREPDFNGHPVYRTQLPPLGACVP